MSTQIATLPTIEAAELARRLREAAKRPLSAKEIEQQTISMVFSSMGHKGNISRAQVEALVRKQRGA